MAHNASGNNQVKTGDKSRLIANPKVTNMDHHKGKNAKIKLASNDAAPVSAEFQFPGKLT